MKFLGALFGILIAVTANADTGDRYISNPTNGKDIIIQTKNSSGTTVEVGRFSPPVGDTARSVGTVGKIAVAQQAISTSDVNSGASFWFLDVDDGATINDDSANARNLTKNGSAVFTGPGFFSRENVLFLDGIDDNLSSSSTFFNPGNGVSFSTGGWVKGYPLTGNGDVISQGTSASDLKYEIDVNAGNVNCRATNTAGSYDRTLTVNQTFDTNSWHHYVMVYDFSATTLKCYIDGQLAASGSLANVRGGGTSLFRIGARFTTPENFFKGNVQDVFFSQQALTDAQVNSLYSRRYSNHAQVAAGHVLSTSSFNLSSLSGKIAYYTLSASDTNTDLSGNSATLTASGSPTYTGLDLFGAANAATLVSASSCYKTTNSFFGSLNKNVTQAMAVGGWFAPANWNANQNLFSLTNNPSNDEIIAIGTISGQLLLYDKGGTAAATMNLTSGSWHHVAAVFDGLYWHLYFDGAPIMSLLATATASSNRFQIGATNDGAACNYSGRVSNFFFGKHVVMGAGDIRKIYASKFTHGKALSAEKQNWSATWLREDSKLSMPLEGNWISDMNANALFMDFSDLSPGDQVFIRSK